MVMKKKKLKKIEKFPNLIFANLSIHLQVWSLVPWVLNCPSCTVWMNVYNCIEDGWRCKNKINARKQAGKVCDQNVRLQLGTFFACSHLSYFQVLGFSHLWARGFPLRFIGNELDISSRHTLLDWSSFCRELSNWGLGSGLGLYFYS